MYWMWSMHPKLRRGSPKNSYYINKRSRSPELCQECSDLIYYSIKQREVSIRSQTAMQEMQDPLLFLRLSFENKGCNEILWDVPTHSC
jgi:hypothetical protein